MSSRLIFLLALATLLLLSALCPSLSKGGANDKSADEEEEEDLSFLEDDNDQNDAAHHHRHPQSDHLDVEDDDFRNYSDFEESNLDPYKSPEVDEKDVVVLKEGNFSDFIGKNKFVMVEFYAPWCGHCQALAPEYAAVATELKSEDVVLAKVDAIEESELAQVYDVQGFPTVYFFVDGVHKPYPGQRTKDAIVTWIKKKTGPGIYNITTLDDAERVLTSESKVALGYLNSLVVVTFPGMRYWSLYLATSFLW
uniref:Thioredoxin domain-containing protein n=1 Tax=Rhizophora mucronata TaxID=61149 RepID=A0A2P2L957_RHIMU